jgi:hypothetical protein
MEACVNVRLLFPEGKRVKERTPVTEVIIDPPDAKVEMYSGTPPESPSKKT